MRSYVQHLGKVRSKFHVKGKNNAKLSHHTKISIFVFRRKRSHQGRWFWMVTSAFNFFAAHAECLLQHHFSTKLCNRTISSRRRPWGTRLVTVHKTLGLRPGWVASAISLKMAAGSILNGAVKYVYPDRHFVEGKRTNKLHSGKWWEKRGYRSSRCIVYLFCSAWRLGLQYFFTSHRST